MARGIAQVVERGPVEDDWMAVPRALRRPHDRRAGGGPPFEQSVDRVVADERTVDERDNHCVGRRIVDRSQPGPQGRQLTRPPARMFDQVRCRPDG